MPFVFDPLPHTEARDRIAALPLLQREVFDELLPELKAYAFTITGLDSFDQLARARDLIKAVPAGEKTWDQAKREIADEIGEALGGKEAQTRAELLLRTHTFRGYAASRYRLLMQQRDVFPYWQYKTHGDARVRPSHAALNGKVFPAGHPIWQRIFPPWDWGCRCLIVPLMGTDPAVQRYRDADEKKAPEHKTVYDGDLADAIHSAERLPNGISLLPSKTWGASPWSEPGTVQHTWALIQERYADQPEVLAAFQQWAQETQLPEMAGATVWDWVTKRGSKAALYDAVPGSQKTPDMRRAENAFIRRHAIPRRDAPSKHVRSPSGDAHDLALQKAALMLDSAHDDGGLRPVRLGRTVLEADAAGEYRPAEGGLMARVEVRDTAGTPLLTTLHELAHHVEHHLRPADVEAVARAARHTITAARIAAEVENPSYWLSNEELFARAYSQFVVMATRDEEALEEMRAALSGASPWRFWPEDQWPEIDEAVRMALTKRGWLP